MTRTDAALQRLNMTRSDFAALVGVDEHDLDETLLAHALED